MALAPQVVPRACWQLTERPESWDAEWIETTEDPRVQQYTWLRQCHGTAVVQATRPGEHAGAIADAAITDVSDAVLVVRTADCAPVLIEGQREDGSMLIGVAHAGWQGLLDGVIAATADQLRVQGATSLVGWLGPCIGPECYEFGQPGLDQLVARFGPTVSSMTRWSTPAFDVPNAVSSAFRKARVTDAGTLPGWSCTACDSQRWYSHRARCDTGRQALFASLSPIATVSSSRDTRGYDR